MSNIEGYQSYYPDCSEETPYTKTKNFDSSSAKINDNLPFKEFVSYMQMDDTMKICSLILEEIIKYNESSQHSQNNKTFSKCSIFDSNEHYNFISIYDYIRRISYYIKYDKFVLILSMMNLDKFMNMNPDFVLTKRNCHKLIFTCIMDTNKYYDDLFITNKIYSSIGGIEIYELLQLEMEFLSKICWNIYQKEDEFYLYSKKLETIFFSH